MKKIHFKTAASFVLVIVLCMSLFLTGCKGNGDEADKYKAKSGVYFSKISMSETQSVELYLSISEDGNFVFARDTAFDSNEKGAGTLGKTEDDEDAFFYTVFQGKEIEKGEKVATYELDENGNIQFTSPMWFGSTEPKIIGEDETVSYPCFEKYIPAQSEEAELEQNSDVSVAKQTTANSEPEESTSTENESTAAVNATTSKASVAQQKTTTAKTQTTTKKTQTTATTTKAATVTTTKSVTVTTTKAAFKEGTYKGSLTKYVDAMSTNIQYDVTVTFSGGKYNYTVKINAMGQTFDENYSGTYTVNGNSVKMTGKLSSGTVSGNSIKLTGVLSSFAGNNEETITVSK